MKKEIYLHVGLYKCASTLIQKTLKEYKNNNLEVFTPENGRQIYDKFRELINKKNQKKNLKFFKSLSSKKKIIISIEGLFGHQSNGFNDINKRFQILEKIFNKPRYLIIFRNQSELLYSAWHQGLRNNLCLDFEKYISLNEKKLHAQKVKNFTQKTNYKIYDYNKIFSKYLKIFPKRVQFINFSIVQKNQNLFLEKILKNFNLNPKNNFYNRKVYNKKIKQYRTHFLAKKIIPSFHHLNMKITIKISYLLNLIDKNKLWNPISLIYLYILDFIFKFFCGNTYDQFYKKINIVKKKINYYFERKNRIFFRKINS